MDRDVVDDGNDENRTLRGTSEMLCTSVVIGVEKTLIDVVFSKFTVV